MSRWPDISVLVEQRQGVSDRLLSIGVGISGLGICTSVPLVYLGYTLCFAGALFFPERLGRFFVGWPFALGLSFWMILAGWVSPFHTQVAPPGWCYSWPALAVWGLALSDIRRQALAMVMVLLGAGLTLGVATAQYGLGYSVDEKPLRISTNGIRGTQASGLYSHWIRFGDAMAFATAWWVVWIASRQVSATRLRLFIIIISGALGVLMSGARGAFMAQVSGLWAVSGSMLSVRRFVVASALLIMLVIGIGALAWPSQEARIRGALAGQDGRTFIWATTWQTLLQRPILGIGNGAYDQAATATVASGLSAPGREGPAMGNAHSSYLSLLVLYGIPGLTLWVLWLGSVLWHLWQVRHRHLAVWPVTMGTIGVFLVAGLTEDVAAYASSRYQCFFGLALALGLSVSAVVKDETTALPAKVMDD